MAHLKKLYDKYQKYGFNVIALSNESPVVVERFMRTVNPQMGYPVLVRASNRYNVTGIPQSYLVGPDGKVVWQGSPGSLSDKQVEKQLRRIPRMSELPGRRADDAGRYADRGQLGKAYEKAMKLVDSRSADAKDKDSAKKIADYVSTDASRKLDWVDALVKAGHVNRAEKILADMQRTFEGTKWAKTAKEKAASLKKDHEGLLKANKMVSRLLERVKTPVNTNTRRTVLRMFKEWEKNAKGAAKNLYDHYVQIFKEKWVPKRS